jgi:hypothetical protein
MSVCATDGSSLTQNFCDGMGTCTTTDVVTSCPMMSCSLGPPPVCQ